MIEILEGTDTYRESKGGRLYPRVTAVIKDAGLGWWPDDPYAMALGSSAHLACRYHDEGDLDWNSLEEAVIPRVKAWIQCQIDLDIKVHAIERPVLNKVCGYAGRLDRIISLPGARRAIVDFSMGPTPKTKALQMVAYGACVSRAPIPRLGIELCADGTYVVHDKFPTHEWQADFRTFVGLVELYNWKRRK